jgi:hypothetical protein
MQVWLTTARKQLESLEELKQCSDWFCHIPKDPSPWLRRTHEKRASVTPQKPAPNMFSHIPRDCGFWLKNDDTAAAVPSSLVSNSLVC